MRLGNMFLGIESFRLKECVGQKSQLYHLTKLAHLINIINSGIVIDFSSLN